MATIVPFLFWRHLRSEPSVHVLRYRSGRLVQSGRGLSFWFLPLSTSVAEVPCDDRDQPFLFRCRSSDFQEVVAQGVVSYRVETPERLAERVDCAIDLQTGLHRKTPLEQLSQLLTQQAQQLAADYLERTPLRQLLAAGVEPLRERLIELLPQDPGLAALGLEVVSVRVTGLSPTSELEKALQAPMRESIQQSADEAVFQRRALAVEKERAIQENELQNRIELARREEALIGQQGQNELRRAGEEAEARKIEAEAAAVRRRVAAEAEAESIRLVEDAKVGAEGARMAVYRDLPPAVMLGLAAQELAGKLETVEHLHISPELLSPLLTRLLQGATRKLEAGGEEVQG